MPDVDFTDLEEFEFEPMPNGRYNVEVHSAEMSDGPGPSGFDYLAVQCIVVDDEDYENRRLFHNFSFSPKALFRFRNFLLAAGWDEDELTETLSFEEDELEGLELVAMVRREKNKETGEIRNVIKNFYSAAEEEAGD
jgi:hypothetical protein